MSERWLRAEDWRRGPGAHLLPGLGSCSPHLQREPLSPTRHVQYRVCCVYPLFPSCLPMSSQGVHPGSPCEKLPYSRCWLSECLPFPTLRCPGSASHTACCHCPAQRYLNQTAASWEAGSEHLELSTTALRSESLFGLRGRVGVGQGFSNASESQESTDLGPLALRLLTQ